MLEDDVVAAMKRTMAITFDSQGGGNVGKGNERESDRIETPSKNGAMVSRFTLQGTEGWAGQATNPRTA